MLSRKHELKPSERSYYAERKKSQKNIFKKDIKIQILCEDAVKPYE